jgi:hypothetical protein
MLYILTVHVTLGIEKVIYAELPTVVVLLSVTDIPYVYVELYGRI